MTDRIARWAGTARGATTTATADVDWKKVAVFGALGLGGAVLGGLALLRRAGAFPRGRRERSRDSSPFAAGDQPDASVAHHFYKTEDFSFIDLSQGRVRYFLRRPTTTDSSKSRVVVLVHGFSIAADIWKLCSDLLVAQGHTVLSFDNYGRGWSDAPDVPYDEQLYVGQLAELLFALDIQTPIDLCGVSMGGAIVSSFVARYPTKVASLCLVCPAGLPIEAPPSMAASIALPLIGPVLFKSALPNMQANGAHAQWQNKDSQAYRAWGTFAKSNMQENDGFSRCLFRTVLNYPMSNQMHNFAVVAQQAHMKKLILWGDSDLLTPYSNGAKLQALLPGSQFVTIVRAKHNMLIERPQPIAEVIASWLAGNKALPTHVTESLDEQAQ